jgi:hypothetical protein
MSSWLFVLIFVTKLLQIPLPGKGYNLEIGDYVPVMQVAGQIFKGSHCPVRPASNRKNKVRQKEIDFYQKSVNFPVASCCCSPMPLICNILDFAGIFDCGKPVFDQRGIPGD